MHLSIIIPLILLASLSCTPKSTERAEAMRLSASVLEYAHSSLVLTQRYWEKGDKFDAILTSDGSRTVVEPASDGGSPYAGCFVEAPAGKATGVIGVYPSGSGAEWQNGQICFDIPEQQDGKPVTLSAGDVEGSPGVYTPYSLEMAPLYSLVMVSLAHMPYMVKALTLRASDCSPGSCAGDDTARSVRNVIQRRA